MMMGDLENNTLLKDKAGLQPVVKEPKTLRVLQIFVSGNKLKNLDGVRDKSDTQVVLKMKWLKDQKDWVQVDQTEVVVDNLSPNYEHHFEVVYNFGSLVALKFECNNINANGKHQLIGECEITIPELVRKASARGLNVPLTGKTKDLGTLEFIVQEPT